MRDGTEDVVAVDVAIEAGGVVAPLETSQAPRKNVFVEFSGLARKLGDEGVDLGVTFSLLWALNYLFTEHGQI